MKWYKKLHREVKSFWDKELRPTVEPILRIIVGQKINEKLEKHKD